MSELYWSISRYEPSAVWPGKWISRITEAPCDINKYEEDEGTGRVMRSDWGNWSCLTWRSGCWGSSLSTATWKKVAVRRVSVSFLRRQVIGCEETASSCARQRCKLDVRENFLPERTVKHRSRLPRAVVESPSLEVCKRCVVMAISVVGQVDGWIWWSWRSKLDDSS